MKRQTAMRFFVLFAFVLLPMASGFWSCSDSSKPKYDIETEFTRDVSCATSTGSKIHAYTLKVGAPYDRSFFSTFDKGDSIIQGWKKVPQGVELPLEIIVTVDEGASPSLFTYQTAISTDWVETATFRALCDETSPMPVIVTNYHDYSLVINIPEECGWFNQVKFFEFQPAASGLIPISAKPINKGRQTTLWQEPIDKATPIVRPTLIDAAGKEHAFDFPLPPQPDGQESLRVDFHVTCDEATSTVFMEASYNGQTYQPGESPSDADGDVDEESLEISERDTTEQTDGDEAEAETSESLEEETDSTPVEDGDIDQTTEAEEEIGEEEAETCGGEMPDPSIVEFEAEAEGVFAADETNPPDAAQVVESDFPDISGGEYVRLSGGEAGHEMVFNLDVATTYEYMLRVYLVGGDDWGDIEIYLDDMDTPLTDRHGTSLFHLANTTGPVYDDIALSPIEIHPLCLEAGTHKIRIRVATAGEGEIDAGLDRLLIAVY